MSQSKPLREALKRRFYPFALEQGFIRGKATSLFVPFERVVDGKIHFFEIQWDKSHRPRFVINFGERANSDHFETLPLPVSGRLQRWHGSTLRTWFQTGKPWFERLRTFSWSYPPDEVVIHLIECFPELENWWRSKQVGPHVSIWSRPNR